MSKYFIIIGLVFLFLTLVSFGVGAAEQTLPSPNREIMFGYYHVDSQYGDFKDEMKDYTNVQIILQDSFLRPDLVKSTLNLPGLKNLSSGNPK